MLSLASRYRDFVDSVFSGLADPTRPAGWPEDLTEMTLQSWWFAGEFGRLFTGTEGQRISIRDFGMWNHSAGPDFTHCTVEIDGEEHHGDIELDPDVRDWERHGHGANPAYKQVVLHLFTQAPAERFDTRDFSHRAIPQVCLLPEMLAEDANPKAPAEARLGRCAIPLATMEEVRARQLIESAAQWRMERKSRKLAILVEAHGREQALFQAFANALGYRHNQRAFTILTQRLPLKLLRPLPALDQEALLFGVSGFLESVRYEDTTDETRGYLRDLWSAWWRLRHAYLHWLEPEQNLPWHTGAARPGNHPQRRLGTLCALLSIWKKVHQSLAPGVWQRREFTALLGSLSHPYWSHHYTLLSAPAKGDIALLGGTRIQEILANVVYPFLLPDKPGLWEQYIQLPAMLENEKVRRAALRLFGDSPRNRQFQKKLFHQQGLVQIYEDFCLESRADCDDCLFPEQLRTWQ